MTEGGEGGGEATQQHAAARGGLFALIVLGVPVTALGIALDNLAMYYVGGAAVSMAAVVAAVAYTMRWF